MLKCILGDPVPVGDDGLVEFGQTVQVAPAVTGQDVLIQGGEPAE